MHQMSEHFAFLDCRASEQEKEVLIRSGLTVVPLPPLASLPAPVASHPDMLVFLARGALVTRARYYRENRDLFDDFLARRPDVRLILTADEGGRDYPADVALNAFLCGGGLFSNTSATAPEIIALARAQGYAPVRVKQGYASCSALVLCEEHLVTADPTIARAAEARGITVTHVGPGDIDLPGYDSGFIGGACGVWNKTLFTCGNLDRYRFGTHVRRAAEENGLRIVPLCDGPLTDRGKILIF